MLSHDMVEWNAVAVAHTYSRCNLYYCPQYWYTCLFAIVKLVHVYVCVNCALHSQITRNLIIHDRRWKGSTHWKRKYKHSKIVNESIYATCHHFIYAIHGKCTLYILVSLFSPAPYPFFSVSRPPFTTTHYIITHLNSSVRFVKISLLRDGCQMIGSSCTTVLVFQKKKGNSTLNNHKYGSLLKYITRVFCFTLN